MPNLAFVGLVTAASFIACCVISCIVFIFSQDPTEDAEASRNDIRDIANFSQIPEIDIDARISSIESQDRVAKKLFTSPASTTDVASIPRTDLVSTRNIATSRSGSSGNSVESGQSEKSRRVSFSDDTSDAQDAVPRKYTRKGPKFLETLPLENSKLMENLQKLTHSETATTYNLQQHANEGIDVSARLTSYHRDSVATTPSEKSTTSTILRYSDKAAGSRFMSSPDNSRLSGLTLSRGGRIGRPVSKEKNKSLPTALGSTSLDDNSLQPLALSASSDNLHLGSAENAIESGHVDMENRAAGSTLVDSAARKGNVLLAEKNRLWQSGQSLRGDPLLGIILQFDTSGTPVGRNSENADRDGDGSVVSDLTVCANLR